MGPTDTRKGIEPDTLPSKNHHCRRELAGDGHGAIEDALLFKGRKPLTHTGTAALGCTRMGIDGPVFLLNSVTYGLAYLPNSEQELHKKGYRSTYRAFSKRQSAVKLHKKRYRCPAPSCLCCTRKGVNAIASSVCGCTRKGMFAHEIGNKFSDLRVVNQVQR